MLTRRAPIAKRPSGFVGLELLANGGGPGLVAFCRRESDGAFGGFDGRIETRGLGVGGRESGADDLALAAGEGVGAFGDSDSFGTVAEKGVRPGGEDPRHIVHGLDVVGIQFESATVMAESFFGVANLQE